MRLKLLLVALPILLLANCAAPAQTWSFKMPNLVGQDLLKAKGRLTQLGFPIENISVYAGDSVHDLGVESRWIVETQEPPPGTVVPVCEECYVSLIIIPLLPE